MVPEQFLIDLGASIKIFSAGLFGYFVLKGISYILKGMHQPGDYYQVEHYHEAKDSGDSE